MNRLRGAGLRRLWAPGFRRIGAGGRRGPGPRVQPSAMSPYDLGNEAVAGLFTRPGRTFLTTQ